MDELKLRHLLARKIPTTELDKLPLARRIKSERLFSSIEECIEYIDCIISNTSLNPDNPFFISYKEEPILAINTLDEATCSIIYEIYQQRFRKDKDSLGYISYQLNDLSDRIMNIIEYSKSSSEYLQYLSEFIAYINFLASPGEFKEEYINKGLSRTYYNLMYTLYKYAKPYSDYFRTMENYYYSLLVKEIY